MCRMGLRMNKVNVMSMKCFARWEPESGSGVCFRDQTILQFGNSWKLLASFVLLNPGSALPLDEVGATIK